LLSTPSFSLQLTAPPEISTLSLHDALPISARHVRRGEGGPGGPFVRHRELHAGATHHADAPGAARRRGHRARQLGCLLADPLERSEEHTSELQSLAYLVCRLLLEKKKRLIT